MVRASCDKSAVTVTAVTVMSAVGPESSWLPVGTVVGREFIECLVKIAVGEATLDRLGPLLLVLISLVSDLKQGIYILPSPWGQ
jgi:high-affinity K+ transport system ATPase subunit B